MEGNVQKMRSALEAALPIMENCPFTHYNTIEVDAVVADMKQSLALPLRNCDTLETYADFVDAWNKYVTSRKSDLCSEPDVSGFLLWLSQPNKKEEGNGKD